MRRELTRPVPGVVGAAVLVALLAVTGCSRGPEAAPADAQRLRLLGGIPAADSERGLYLVDLDDAGELSPGSRVGPFLGAVLGEAKLLVETTAPPVTLLGGVDEDVETPSHALRVADTLVFAEEPAAQQAADLLTQGATPGGELTAAAASSAPVVWVGPTPAQQAQGRTLLEFDADAVTFTVTPTGPLAQAVASTRHELAEGAPEGSPGKGWSTMMTDAEVTTEGDAVVIRAVPNDLPGPLLRSLVDQRQLSFLPG